MPFQLFSAFMHIFMNYQFHIELENISKPDFCRNDKTEDLHLALSGVIHILFIFDIFDVFRFNAAQQTEYNCRIA